jgi:hypothetical protein
MKPLLLILLFACGQSKEKQSNSIYVDVAALDSAKPVDDTSRQVWATVGPTTMILYQGEDTIQFPLHPDYKEYIFWFTMTSWHEYTYRTSLLYLKSKPSQSRLRREANRLAAYLGYDSTTVVVRECIAFNPEDSMKWDKADQIFKKQFLATIK